VEAAAGTGNALVITLAGPLAPLHSAKWESLIYDYFEADEPQLAKNGGRWESRYKALGL
jgi:hypothetical protein